MNGIIMCALFDLPENLERLIAKGININAQDSDGNTPIMICIMHRHLDVFNILVTYEPDLHIQNKNGQTALMLACSIPYSSFIEPILKLSPNLMQHDNDWCTCFDYAIVADGSVPFIGSNTGVLMAHT